MRRPRLTRVSQELLDYLVEQKGLTQNEIAGVLDVDKSFVSRLRSGERQFSPLQMEILADHLGVPLGAMLIAATDPKEPLSPEQQELSDLCAKVMRQADEAVAALRASQAERVRAKARG
jgi:transcriptional regulator with XRE-family HTH domain